MADSHSASTEFGDTWEALTTRAFTLLTSAHRADATPAVQLARSLHANPPSRPAAIDASRGEAVPTLARYAQAGDPHALLMAAVLVRDQLRDIAAHLGGDDDAQADTLAAFFTLLRTAAEPDTLTERSIAVSVLRCLSAAASGPQEAVLLEPDAAVFDQPAPDHPDPCARATRLLDQAQTRGVITALEHQTLTALYLDGRATPTTAAHTLHASTSAIQRRAQRAIGKLAATYRPHRHLRLVGAA